MSLEIERLIVSPFQQNCRILYCSESKEGVVVDPGDEAERILSTVNKLGVKVQYILATHGHIDHIAAVADVQDKLKVPFYIHKDDEHWAQSLPAQAMMFGLSGVRSPKIDDYISEGQEFSFGECTCTTLHTPGHSPGSVSFLFGNQLFSGDLIFAGSIGRVDLPGGSIDILRQSVVDKVFPLSSQGEISIYSGHGPDTTLSAEVRNLKWILNIS